MGKAKTVFKIYSIPEYRKEEEFLSSMHRQGWKFTKVTFPGFYHFEQCEPENVTYRLDYNQDGVANKAEYVQMFSDCGWEYLFDFVGYSYFRKTSDEGNMNEEIFCDDDSRLDMMKRVYKGKVMPLVIIFLCIILPQFIMNTVGYGGGSIVQDVLSITFLFLGILYIVLLGSFSVQFYQYEKSVHPEDNRRKVKYCGIMASLVICAFIMVGAVCFSFSSDYTLHEYENGFIVEADRLNKSIVKEYNLKKGDSVAVSHEAEGGELYISIKKENEEPVFYGNTFGEWDDFSVNIQEDGCYQITCSGKKAKGTVRFTIK